MRRYALALLLLGLMALALPARADNSAFESGADYGTEQQTDAVDEIEPEGGMQDPEDGADEADPSGESGDPENPDMPEGQLADGEPMPTPIPAPLIQRDAAFYDQVAGALADPTIIQTYEYLKTGATIEQGAKGATYIGLQALLNYMGVNLELDGSIGSGTMRQLQSAQRRYGMIDSDIVNQQIYEELLINAYILRDPLTAGALLGSEFDRQIRYVLGALNEQRGEFFSAKRQYDTLEGYRDAAMRAQNCIRPWPKAGEVLREDGYTQEDCLLRIRTNRPKEQATYIKVYNGKLLVLGIFVPGTDEIAITLPKGNYTFKAGVGKTWYGPKEAFGVSDDSFYQRLVFNGEGEIVVFNPGRRYTLTLGGAEQNNITTRSENAETF